MSYQKHNPNPSRQSVEDHFEQARLRSTSSRSHLMRLSAALLLLTILMFNKLGSAGVQANSMMQATAPAMPATDYPLTGQLVSVGDYRLYIQCAGQGSPTVILDAGYSGNSARDWSGILPLAAKFSHVCAYDRVGRGKSDLGPTKVTFLQLVEDLHRLLTNAHIEGPYVLAGLSFGGLVSRLYASKYPSDVEGEILVEAPTETIVIHGPSLPDIDMIKSAEEVQNLPPFPNIPLIVISRGDSSKGPNPPVPEDVWQEGQRELVHLSPQGKQIIADKSGHNVQIYQPELILASIRYVVETARNGSAAPTLTPFWTPIPTMAATAAAVTQQPCVAPPANTNQIKTADTNRVLTEYPIPTADSKPGPIALGPDGALWFWEAGSNQFGRLTTGGKFTEYPVSSVSPGNHFLTAGPDGAIWFTEPAMCQDRGKNPQNKVHVRFW